MITMSWYLLTGVAAGVLSGMLGIGGGLVVVPLLLMLFAAGHVANAVAVPLAIGTSLASIVFTSVSSARAHALRGSIAWPLVWTMTPALVVGVAAGATASSVVPAAVPMTGFLAYCVIAATRLLRDARPQGDRLLPGPRTLSAVGFVMSAAAGMLGVGAASIVVPYLAERAVPTRTAMGTAAALSVPMAIAGAWTYLLHGLHADGLPQEALGFIHLEALAGVALGSMLAAPLGVSVAHRLPVPTLRKIFAGVLYIAAGKIGVALLLS